LENALEANAPRVAVVELYDTSAWDAAVATGKLSAIRPMVTLASVSQMYHRIAVARRWDLLQVQCALSTHTKADRLSELQATVLEARRLAREAITQYFAGTGES